MEKQISGRYDLIIVFSSSELFKKAGRYFYAEIYSDKNSPEELIYLGGETRMRAAVELASFADAFVLVGAEKRPEEMRFYLENKIKNRKLKIIRIDSKDSTLGNLWAVKKCFQSAGKMDFLKEKRIGVLTNFYHLLRVMRFSADIFPKGVSFIPLAAEAFIEEENPVYYCQPEACLKRLRGTIKGLLDWEMGRYQEQKEAEDCWLGKCYDPQILANL